MIVKDIARELGLKPINEADTDRIVAGCYIGDLLSNVMVKARKNDIWITIIRNLNVAAVAVLSDVSMVIIAENSPADADLLKKASEHGVNLYSTSYSAYELAVRISELLK